MDEVVAVSESQLFERWRGGNDEALAKLIPVLYEELRGLARSHLGGERKEHTLQPTALVHEAFLRLLGAETRVQDRAHFFSLASHVMRRVLIDHARRHGAAKRNSGGHRVTLVTDLLLETPNPVDVLDLHHALEDLCKISGRGAQVVELRYFGGLTLGEVAEVLEISEKTVERDWTAARLWLKRELSR